MIYLYQHHYDKAYVYLMRIEATLNTTSFKQGQIQAKLRLAACQLERNQQEETTLLLKEVASLLTATEDYKQLVLIELKWLPTLSSMIKSVPHFAHLRALLGWESTLQKETWKGQKSSTSEVEVISSHRLTIRAFGMPIVLFDEQPVKHWRMTRAMELFFFLLDANYAMSKEQIIAALWPEFDNRTNQTFHSTVHHLRKLFGASSIVFDADCYHLNLATHYVWYDVEEFHLRRKEAQQALAEGDDTQAREALLKVVDLYRGDYGQPFYNDWCTARRDDLRTTYMETNEQLAQIAWRAERYNECIDYWRKVLSINNCLEEPHYNIMRCYLYQGKQSMALHQYQLCKEILQQELSIQPSNTIQNLYQRLTGISRHNKVRSSFMK
jgi:two-component SAPR family response regulator